MRTAAALLISCAATAAHAFAVAAPLNPAVDVALSGWAFGSGHKVSVSATTSAGTLDYRGHAGAFTGTLAGAGDMDSADFVTWCIELEERVSFGQTLGYSLVTGSDYFGERRGDAGIAERLGRLLTYAADNASLVENNSGSTALQLAVWNLVYDSDWSVTDSGPFKDASSYRVAATALLVGAQGVTASRYDVFALERSGGQDLLALALREPAAAAAVNDVPEPGTLALAGSALLGLLLARRRRPAA